MARRSGRRTDYSWSHVGDELTAVDIGIAARSGEGFEFQQAQTLTRVRGRVGASLNAAAVSEHGLLLLGLAIVGQDAFAGGTFPELASAG